MILSSSILSADFNRLGSDIEKAVRAGSDYIHVDVMDGLFVPSISFGMPVLKAIRKETDTVLDVHLMIEEPIRYVKEFADLGADIITVHYEACSDVRTTLEAIKSTGVRVGLSVKPATDVTVVYPFLETIDMVLVMTVEPGFGGQKLIEATMDKVQAVRQVISERGLNTDVEIDGGVTKENVKKILEAGANVIVAGSAVFNGDIASNVGYLKLID